MLLGNGCGFVSLLGTPSRHEGKVAAEYNLAERKSQKLLVLVNQPSWVRARTNLRFYLTEAIQAELERRIEMRPDNLVSYDEVSGFRSGRSDFAALEPWEVGKALGADMVLLVTVQDYYLADQGQTGYYKGSLGSQVLLIDAGTRAVLWPKSGDGKEIRVGFEIEPRGHETAVARLAFATAHCIVRYLYDCRQNKFKIGDDVSEIHRQQANWQMISGDAR
jgi:hypothetical protein